MDTTTHHSPDPVFTRNAANDIICTGSGGARPRPDQGGWMFNVINKAPVSLTPAAVAKVKEIVAQQGQAEAGLRIYIAGGGCSGFKYGMTLDTDAAADDEVVNVEGLKIFIDSMSLPYLQGASV